MPSDCVHVPRSAATLIGTLLACLLVGSITTLADGQPNGTAPISCPGVFEQVCTTDCQTAVCRALSSFYRATYNASQAWQHQKGWNLTANQSCEELLVNGTVYCHWDGVQCCTPEMARKRECTIVHAVRGLDLEVNRLNGSVDNSVFMNSLLQLHACGISKLQLQGNDLSGNMSSPAWGQLVNLTILDLANNWLSGTIPDTLRQLKRLTRLSLGTNQFSGSVPDWFGDLLALETLNVGANTGVNEQLEAAHHQDSNGRKGLTGTIPASLSNLVNLTVLNLELNSLSGALPAGLCQPPDGVSKLRVLKLRGNRLSGDIRELRHCSSLAQLDLSSNRFKGPFQVGPENGHTVWPNLAVLDASNNQFTGSIPVTLYEFPVLEYLNLANNRFTGQIHPQITLSSYLKELNLEHNMLTGPIDPDLWLLPHLRLLDLGYNRLSGTIDSAIGRTINLEELQLSNNNLSGPIPPQLGFLKKIDIVNLIRNNQLTCRMQQQQEALVNNTGNSLQAVEHCSPGQLLPCFLVFSNYTVPRTDSSNMTCPLVLRRDYDDAQQACAGDGRMQLGKLAGGVAAGMADEQVWKVEPSYFQYKGCHCLPGYQEVWARNHTVLVCTPKPVTSRNDWIRGIIQACSIAGALFLAAVALLVWLRMAVQLRPRWQREKELAKNRKKGMPAGCPASIVVTDIEKYSELMQSNAPLATKALGIHNSILRRAAAAHAGNVVEQEGDSWSIAFHTPIDAVAFCLQVQQALYRVNWPRDLGAARSQISQLAATTPDGAAVAGAAAGRGSPSCSQLVPVPAAIDLSNQQVASCWQQQQQQGFNGTLDTAKATAVAAAPAVAGWVRVPDGLWHLQQTGSTASAVGEGCETLFAGRSAGSGSSTVSSAGGPDFAVHAGSGSSSCRFSVMHSDASGKGSSLMCKDTLEPADSPVAATASSWFGGSSGRTKPPISSKLQRPSRFWSIIGFSQAIAAAAAERHGSSSSGSRTVDGSCLRGLRVRMGVASGYVPQDTNIARCALLELAKGVSDLAHGGQILLDRLTFSGIRDRLTELGGVDHRGYNDITLAQAARAAMRQQTSGLVCRLMGKLSICLAVNKGYEVSAHDSDALLLDMGEYYSPVLAPVVSAAAEGLHQRNPNSSPAECSSNSLANCPIANLVAVSCGNAALAMAAAAVVDADGSTTHRSQLLQVYSILPRCFAGRAKQWGSQLATKDDMQRTTLNYFDAPGTDVVDLCPAKLSETFSALSTPNSQKAAAAALTSSLLFLPAPLPAVTMVFVAVETGRGSRRQDVTRSVHQTISRTMQVLLMAFAEGSARRPAGACYLCREQEGELKYMLAFREPAQALEWSLMLQEVVQLLPWPTAVLDTLYNSNLLSPTAAAAANILSYPVRYSNSGSSSDGGSSSSIVSYPVLRIGLAEGQPHSISPDHLGRADYHGPSVNLAARMLAAAAAIKGGVVTSVEMAQSIFSSWCYQAALHQFQQPHIATAAAAAGLEKQCSSTLDAGSCIAAGHTDGAVHPWSNSRRSTDQMPAGQHGPQQQRQLWRYDSADKPSLDAGHSHCSSTAPLLHTTASTTIDGSGAVVKPAAAANAGLLACPKRLVHVSGWHIGTFHFKGCGTLDMVTFSIDSHRQGDLGEGSSTCLGLTGDCNKPHVSLEQLSASQTAVRSSAAKGGKGLLLLPRDGPVVGLQNCPVMMPDVLPSLGRAWVATAAAASCMKTSLTSAPAGTSGRSGSRGSKSGTQHWSAQVDTGAPYEHSRSVTVVVVDSQPVQVVLQDPPQMTARVADGDSSV